MFDPSPALLRFRDHARERQTDIAIPLPERQLWKQLADEIETYVVVTEPGDDRAQKEALF